MDVLVDMQISTLLAVERELHTVMILHNACSRCTNGNPNFVSKVYFCKLI